MLGTNCRVNLSEVALACPSDDGLVEILSCVPAHCKSWCDLIADCLRCSKFPQALEGSSSKAAVATT